MVVVVVVSEVWLLGALRVCKRNDKWSLRRELAGCTFLERI